MPTLVKAIQKAGGITQSADLKEVELIRLLPGNKNEYKTTKLNLINLSITSNNRKILKKHTKCCYRLIIR